MAKITKNIEKKGEVILKRFGKYLLLDHLVDGGMAKICRARFLGEQADKIVAIKMIQSKYSDDETFKRMFMDEIKVTFGLIHPNIAQTYDYGIHESQLYTAMEYVNGKNLKEYLERLKKKKFVFPVEISVYIISQVCQGLHYAHNFTDMLTGKKSNIIHRDISPHNIMLTYDGAVKVIDFGIAKVDTNKDATKAGTIKGKLSYLAPEYLEGLKLDHRYDQFAVGNTLWEMLCSRKLFKAPNELAVLKEVQNCKIPRPSSINPNVPKELDEIVLKTLSKDRNKRYANLDQLNRALVEFLYKNYPTFNPTDLSYFAKGLFKKDIETDQERLFEFGKMDISTFIAESKYELNGPAITESGDEAEFTGLSKIKKAHTFDFGFEKMESKKNKVRHTEIKERCEDEIEKAQTEKIKLNLKKSGQRVKKPTQDTIQVNEAASKQQDSDKTEHINRKKVSKSKKLENKFIKNGVIVATLAGVALLMFYPTQEGKNTEITKVEIEQDESRPAEVVKKEVETGKITLGNFDGFSHTVYANGKKVDVDVFGNFKYPMGQKIVIRVESKGRQHFIYTLDSLSDENPEVRIEISEMPPQDYAYLKSSRNCFKGRIEFELFGEYRTARLPISSKKGVEIPIKKDGRGLASTFNITLIEEDGRKPKRTLQVTPQSANDLIDICDLIYK